MEADRRLMRDGEGRSGMLRRLVEEALCRQDEAAKVTQFIRGWREEPETDEEFGWAVLGLGALEDLS